MDKRCHRATSYVLACVALACGRAAAQPCQTRWSDEFAPTGLDSYIWDLAVFDDGSGPALYAAGGFEHAGHVTVNRVARLDGVEWKALGAGIDDGSARSLAACAICPDEGANLYVGGAFQSAGEVAAAQVARWDGETWSPLGLGIDADDVALVQALLVTDGLFGEGPVLYAAGYFESAGGVPAENIARWDGGAWSSLGAGVGKLVYDLEVFDDGSGPALYAAGSFETAGGVTVNHIARWDGETWSDVSGGTNGSVQTLAVFDDGWGPALYAGGFFDEAGGLPVSGLARWDGTAWSEAAPFVGNPPWHAPVVKGLTVFDDGTGPALYVTGNFGNAGGVPVLDIARWDGNAWSALGGGLNEGSGWGLAGLADDETGQRLLYAFGSFREAGGMDLDWIAAWDGAAWSGVDRVAVLPESWLYVHDLETFDDGSGDEPAVYLGGEFIQVARVQTSGLARYDGQDWSSPDGGVDGEVLALEVFDDGSGAGAALYVGGWFDAVGSEELAAGNIARWDGEQWTPVGGGVGPENRGVHALAAAGDLFGEGPALYAGGRFTEAGASPASLVARWDGGQWSPLSDGIDAESASVVRALAVVETGPPLGPALYAGGRIQSVGALPTPGIARWDGDHWSALGTGVDDEVWALAVFDDGLGAALYAAGGFTTAGEVNANGIARWDGATWSAVGGGVSGSVFDLAVLPGPFGNATWLYAGGDFDAAGGVAADGIARFNGVAWTPLGEGLAGYGSTALALAVHPGDATTLLVAGDFQAAGGIPSPMMSRWTGCPAAAPPWAPLIRSLERGR